MKRFLAHAPVAIVAFLVIGCGSKGDANASPDKSGAPSAAAAGDEAPKNRPAERAGRAGSQMSPLRGDTPQMKAILSPAEVGYPDSGAKPIAASCTSPWVLLATAPPASGDDYAFPWVAQSFLANPQFKVTDEPHSGGEVAIEIHKKTDYFLIVRCHDAGNCNRLASMYKAVVKSSSPESGCGDLPKGLSGATRTKSITPSLPDKSDTVSLCARIGACSTALDPMSAEEPGSACQKAPKSFKTECALKATCEDVAACLK